MGPTMVDSLIMGETSVDNSSVILCFDLDVTGCLELQMHEPVTNFDIKVLRLTTENVSQL